jgi:protein-disulfide isomerase
MLKKYLLTGFLIVASLIALVWAVKTFQGFPKALTQEPWKTKGPSDAPVFIVEFSDFGCPNCAEIQPILRKILKDFPDDLRLVFKHFPLASHMATSLPAAEAAECAAEQGRFWEYHDLLFLKADDWSHDPDLKKTLNAYAQSLGLDMTGFQKCLDSGVKKHIPMQNKAEGKRLLVNSTPTLLLDGKKMLATYDTEQLERTIVTEIYKRKRKP